MQKLSTPGSDVGDLIKSVLGGLPSLLGQQQTKLNGFLKINGINSESSQTGHEDEIEVLDYHWTVTQPRSASASSVAPLTTERAHFGDLIVYKGIDLSSPELAYACSSGTYLPSARFQLCRAGTVIQPYMEYNLTGVIITSIRTGGHGYGQSIPLEELSLSYATIEWKYIKTSEKTGMGSGQVVKKWDLKANK